MASSPHQHSASSFTSPTHHHLQLQLQSTNSGGTPSSTTSISTQGTPSHSGRLQAQQQQQQQHAPQPPDVHGGLGPRARQLRFSGRDRDKGEDSGPGSGSECEYDPVQGLLGSVKGCGRGHDASPVKGLHSSAACSCCFPLTLPMLQPCRACSLAKRLWLAPAPAPACALRHRSYHVFCCCCQRCLWTGRGRSRPARGQCPQLSTQHNYGAGRRGDTSGDRGPHFVLAPSVTVVRYCR